MVANPFAIVPGASYGPGLSGLARSVEHVGEIKAKQKAKEKYEKMKADAVMAYQSGDTDKIAEFMISNPEMAKAVEAVYQFKSDTTKKNYLDSAYKILEAHERHKSGAPPSTAPTTVETGPIQAAGEYPYDPSVLSLEEPPGTPFLDAEGKPIPQPEGALPPEMADIIAQRKEMLAASGATPKETTHTDAFEATYTKNPDAAIKKIEHDIASMDPKGWQAWKEIYRPEDEGAKVSAITQKYNEWKKLKDQGFSDEHPGVSALARVLWPEEGKGAEVAPSNIQKMITEREAMKNDLRAEAKKRGKPISEEELDRHPDILGFNRKIRGEQKVYKPSSLMQMWNEMEDEKDKLREEGVPEEEINNHPLIRALNNKIMGVDIDMAEFKPEQIDFWGAHVLLTGRMPSLGRGKQATKLRAEIARSAAEQAYKLFGMQYPGGKATALSAALEAVATSKDTNVIGMALGILEKQRATMGSFVTNLNNQVAKAKELAKELPKIPGFDNRIMNYGLRKAITTLKGDARYSKYGIYLAEISRELNKLASGATASIAAPSTEENRIWDKLIDKDLPLKDMLSLLDEVEPLANLRVSSVQKQLESTRTRMRTRGIEEVEESQGLPQVNTQEDYDRIQSGEVYFDVELGRKVRKR